MNKLLRASAILVVLVPAACGCQAMPRWDWWRSSASSGPPPEALANANSAPKYPQVPSSSATPANIAAINNSSNPVPPGTSAPAGGYPSTSATLAGGASPGEYPSTVGSYGPQTGAYNANGYNPYAGAGQPTAHLASNPGAPSGGYNPAAAGAYPSTGGYPATNQPAYPGDHGGYPATTNSYPGSGSADPYGANGGPNSTGYATGSRYDTGGGDRYGTNPGAPDASQYGAPPTGGYPGGAGAPAGGYNNYGAPNQGYPTTPGDTGGYDPYRGADTTPPANTANYAAQAGSSGDRYSGYGQNASAGPAVSTADYRSGASPSGEPRYDNAVTPASGGSYLPAGTKRLESDFPNSAPSGTVPTGGAPASTSPYGGAGSFGSFS